MIGEAMTETYDEHMAEMLRLGGAHECASDCPQPLPRTREHESPYPSGPICAACGGTDAPVVDVPLHPKCAEQPSGPQTAAGPTRRIKYSVGEYIWAEATNVTPAKAHAMAAEIDRWYAARREPLDVERHLLAEAIFESGVRQTMSQSEQAADNILAELAILRTRHPSSIPDTGTARQKHAAWCWLPADHQGLCEGDQ